MLGTKLDALTADQCYRNPASQVPRGCEKYVTELGSTVGTVRAAGLTASADALDKGVGAYRAAHCETVSATSNPCSKTLSDIAATVTTIKQKVEVSPPGHG